MDLDKIEARVSVATATDTPDNYKGWMDRYEARKTLADVDAGALVEHVRDLEELEQELQRELAAAGVEPPAPLQEALHELRETLDAYRDAHRPQDAARRQRPSDRRA